MPLSIYSNLLARNVAGNLKEASSRLSDSVRRLSSGLRINSAADDASGLAIRELMRADVTTINQGVRNANDAISLIQTADGALAVIDEKLIRMKELAEQAATGTYDSTQRMLINNEFQAMGAEIDRIAHATDFNGIKLLDGSLAGVHDGSGLKATGALRVHFGTGNDSAEDYYNLSIGDSTLAGLGLAVAPPPGINRGGWANPQAGQIVFADGSQVAINKDTPLYATNYPVPGTYPWDPWAYPPSTVQETFWVDDWNWSCGVWSGFGFLHRIPAGTKNFMFNLGITSSQRPVLDIHGNVFEDKFDTDIQLFTMNGTHLAGTPLSDVTYTIKNNLAYDPPVTIVSNIETYSPWLGFTEAEYDGTQLNSGPADYDTGPVDNSSLSWSTYNGMRIGYSGDGNLNNDGKTQAGAEVLVIDGEVTEDLIIWVPGNLNVTYRMYWDGGRTRPEDIEQYRGIMAVGPRGLPVSVETQEQAQQALERIDGAIVKKDRIRANLGAMQNRLENTVTNLNVQAENLQAAEARISDVDIAAETPSFVRSQILAQSAVAMLAQANLMPRMAMQIIG